MVKPMVSDHRGHPAGIFFQRTPISRPGRWTPPQAPLAAKLLESAYLRSGRPVSWFNHG